MPSITFCCHSMNRLHQLRETLQPNLRSAAAQRDVTLVLLDYHSQDGTQEWVREHAFDSIKAGRLIYGRLRESRPFHASCTKNLAHRLATSEILVNLDVDNFIDHTIPVIRDFFATHRQEKVLHIWSGMHGDGTYGRIALSRQLFQNLGGYDESLLPAGYQDTDLLHRAAARGAVVRTWRSLSTIVPRALRNDKHDTVRHTGLDMDYTQMQQANAERSRESVRLRRLSANEDAPPPPEVEINFGEAPRGAP